MLKLHFKDQRQSDIWLVESVTTIGSNPKSHILIKEEGVDQQHAEIRKDGDALYLSDLGSYSGTQVNGSKIKQHFQLRAGDVVTIAGVDMLIQDSARVADAPAPKGVRSDWSIMALAGELKGKSIPIHGSMVFGRSNNCDIVVKDNHMSRRHAEINLKGGVLRIVDLQSSNGTCVNGEKVGEKVLKPGDKIGFDHLTFLVAGPASIAAVEEDEDEDDEATVFRAAPIPRKAPEPKPVIKTPAPAMEMGAANVENQQQKSMVPWVILGVVVVVAVGVGMAFMFLPG